MFNPQGASKSPLSSRIALPAALLLAGVFGLAIAMLQPVVVLHSSPVNETPGAAEIRRADLAGTDARDPKTASPDLVDFCAANVTENRSFVIFKRGTCVVIQEPSDDPVAEARRILRRGADPGARFLSEPTAEGDLIVIFQQPVFQRFGPAELKQAGRGSAARFAALLSPTEAVTAADGWVPPETARLGLLARRRMLEDAADAVPVKVVRAKQRNLVAN